jgi:hypothetical protein
MPGGAKQKFVDLQQDPICRLAQVYAEKYAEAGEDFGSFRISDTSLLRDDRFVACWRAQLKEHNVPTNYRGHLHPTDLREQPSIAFTGNMVITRGGDTIHVEKDFFATNGKLSWYGGPLIPGDSVFLVIDKKGQRVMKAKTGTLVATGFYIADRDPCSQGLVYAHIYAGLSPTLREMPNVERSIWESADFFDCYALEKERIGKDGEGWRMVATIMRAKNIADRLVPIIMY